MKNKDWMDKSLNRKVLSKIHSIEICTDIISTREFRFFINLLLLLLLQQLLFLLLLLLVLLLHRVAVVELLVAVLVLLLVVAVVNALGIT